MSSKKERLLRDGDDGELSRFRTSRKQQRSVRVYLLWLDIGGGGVEKVVGAVVAPVGMGLEFFDGLGGAGFVAGGEKRCQQHNGNKQRSPADMGITHVLQGRDGSVTSIVTYTIIME